MAQLPKTCQDGASPALSSNVRLSTIHEDSAAYRVLQLVNGHGSSHKIMLSARPPPEVIDRTCHHPHRPYMPSSTQTARAVILTDHPYRSHIPSSMQIAHAIILTDRTCHHPHRPYMLSSTQTAHAVILTDRTCHNPHKL